MQSLENFELDQADKYILSIRIAPRFFAYCISQIDTREIFHFEEIPFSSENNQLEEIQQIVFDSAFLSYPFNKTNVIFVSKDYDLAPQYLVQQDKKNRLYNFTHSTPATQILYSEDIIQQVITIFNTDEDLYKFFARNLYNPKFYHHTNVVMRHLEGENRNIGETPKMYINVHDEFADIFCYDESSQILQAITLENKNEQSIVYYILNIWEKCGFDQNKMSLFFLGGYSIPNLYILAKLKEYIRNVETILITKKNNVVQTERQIPLDLIILST